MKDRIRQIMESQHMTQQVFAQYVGVSPAMLSSIYTGRTNPSLNIVEAIKKKIPNISTDWLMFGLGDMYQSAGEQPQAPAVFASAPQDLSIDFDPAPSPTPSVAPQNVVSQPANLNSVRSTRQEMTQAEMKFIDKPQRRVIEIRVFYDDQTWDTFVPAKK
jgi:transcriptional regulator with XRE-family HTH domain